MDNRLKQLSEDFTIVSDILRDDAISITTIFDRGKQYRARITNEVPFTHANLRAHIRRMMMHEGYTVEFLRDLSDLPYYGYDIGVDFTYCAHADADTAPAPEDENHEQKALF